MSRFPGRRPAPADEGIAMVYLIVTLLVSTLALLALTAAVTAEVSPTRHQAATTRAVSAAEAGLNRGLGAVRAARAVVNGATVGDETLLPCAPSSAPLTGSLGTGVGYSVVIRYFSDDPTGHDETWRRANALTCTTGAGVSPVPAYALLQSTATGSATVYRTGAAERSLEQVYELSSTDTQTRGGLVRTSPDDTTAVLCWDAGTSAPAVGSVPTLQPCVNGSASQGFSYAPDYSLLLAASVTANPSTSRCLSADPRLAADLSNTATGARAGGANALTAQGGSPAAGVLGPVSGSAVSFPGYPARYVSSTARSRGVSGSVAVWFRTSAASGTLVEFSSAQTTSTTKAERSLWVNAAGRLVWAPDYALKKTVTSTSSVADGGWHLAVGTVGPAGAALYVDGTLVASDATAVPSSTNSGYWHVGWGSAVTSGWVGAPTNAYWQGSLAHVATYDVQLTGSQVGTLAGATGSYSSWQSAVQALLPTDYWALGGSYTDMRVTFRACDGTAHQEWNYNDYGKFEDENPQGTGRGGLCLSAASYTAGTPLTLVDCWSGASQWEPDTTVGAGGAGEATAQLVNYGEYSRCLDDTNWQVTWPYLIAYPCKQEAGGTVGWNQRWYYDTASRGIYLANPTRYCLDAAAAPALDRVVLRQCDGSPGQVWTMNKDTGLRRTAYTVVSAGGRCLSLGAPGATSGSLSVWSTITADPCDGSKRQKWNAPPLSGDAGVEGYRETTKG